MQGHSIYMLGGHRNICSCGFSGSSLEVLGHALPLNTRSLAAAVAADPESTPEMIARSEALAQESADVANRSQA